MNEQQQKIFDNCKLIIKNWFDEKIDERLQHRIEYYMIETDNADTEYAIVASLLLDTGFRIMDDYKTFGDKKRKFKRETKNFMVYSQNVK